MHHHLHHTTLTLVALTACSVFLLLCGAVFAAAPSVVPLWDGTPPDSDTVENKQPETCENDRIRNVHVPTLTVHLPGKADATGAGVVICPGGGYWLLAFNHEGTQIAEWLNSFGVAAFILKYRHTPYKHPIPLHDTQRALRLVRHNAKKWRVNPKKIGIMGFSAGGHLASTAGTHFDKGDPKAKDPVDRQSCRPDFMILGYPVISFTKEYSHGGSRRNLLGSSPDEKLVKLLSNELQVTKETPPAFLFHASDDRGVPPRNSISFYLALQKNGVPAELHLYLKGGHGFGMVKGRCTAAVDWPGRCELWLREIGMVP